MSSSRDAILNKLRQTRRPFEDAPPRPKAYLPVTVQDDVTPEALLERFSAELTRLMATPIPVNGDAEAREAVIGLLHKHAARCMIAWDFAHIPVEGLEGAIRAAGVEIMHPETHDEFRAEMLAGAETAQVGLTGADAAAATTGTLIFRTGPGKGRIPTVLAPVHIAVVTLDQLLPRLESWFAAQRERDAAMRGITDSANFCFITGPSRTGDIEMELILGVHGPGTLYVVIKR
ncbi:MAG: LUD domain-containing protein [bacterium]|nr:LUD domain-containing protein [bacterium]